MQQESVDLDVPEEKVAKRASTEILEGERLDDLESCMVGENILEISGFGVAVKLFPLCEGGAVAVLSKQFLRHVWV